MVAVLAAGATGCVVRVESDGFRVREEKRFTTKGRPTVQLATFDGSIVIRGWDRNEVSVEIEKRGRDKAAAEAIEVVAEQKGDVVRVEARKKDLAEERRPTASAGTACRAPPSWSSRSRPAAIWSSAPATAASASSTSTAGSSCESADGSVTGRELTGDVVAHTEDGAIRLEGIDGRCDVASDDGSIAVQGRFDGLRVSTEDGSVVVRANAGSKIDRDWNLSTGDGSMVLYVADGLAADVDAEARDGSVRLDSGLTFARDGGIARARRCAAASAPAVRAW